MIARKLRSAQSNWQSYIKNNSHQTNTYCSEIHQDTQTFDNDRTENSYNNVNYHQLQMASNLYSIFNESWFICSVDSFKAFLFALPLEGNSKIKWVQTGSKKNGKTPNTELLCLLVIYLRDIDTATIKKFHYQEIINTYFYIEDNDKIIASDLYKIKDKIKRHKTIKDPFIEVLEDATDIKYSEDIAKI